MPYLRAAYQKCVKHPIVILMPVIFGVLNFMFQSRASSLDPSEALQGWWVAVLVFVAAISPAVASGFNAVVGTAAKDRSPSLKDFTGNLSTYYWRIVGAAVVAGIAVSLLAGRFFMSSMAAGTATGQQPWRLQLVGLVSTLPVHVWFAALVLDGCSGSQAVSCGWRSLLLRPRDYGAFAAAALGTGLILAVAGRILPAAAQLVPALVSAVLVGYLRLAAFLVYEGAFSASLPGISGLKPPLDARRWP